MSRALRTATVGLLLASVTSLFAAGPAATGIAWQSDLGQARKQAQAEGKLLLVSVHATWCPPCRMMEKTTLRDPSVVAAVNADCVAVHLDGDRDARLLGQWTIDGFPTDLLLSPTGRLVGRVEGYVGAAEYMAEVKRAAQASGVAARKSSTPPGQAGANALADGRRAPGSANSAAEGTAFVPASSQQVVGDDGPNMLAPKRLEFRPIDPSQPVALDGHCPVSMIARGVMVAGDESFSLSLNGSRYFFASAKDRDEFKKAPLKFLPGEEGHCVVTWAEANRWVAGDIEYPALFCDRVFFFKTDEQRQKFLRDPEYYVNDDGRAYRTAQTARPSSALVR